VLRSLTAIGPPIPPATVGRFAIDSDASVGDEAILYLIVAKPNFSHL
jgi:hypothetical protein